MHPACSNIKNLIEIMTENLTEKKLQDNSERMTYFSSILRGLKERNLVSEIMERELLLMLINTHQDNIFEYPLLPVQQQSVIDIVTVRSAEDESLSSYINQLVAIFVQELTQFSRLKQANKDVTPTVQKLINCETLLLKCIQGVCYTLALCQDNFYEVCLRRFGSEAAKISDTIIETQALDDGYWAKHFEEFLNNQVQNAFDELIKQQQFILNKSGSKLILTYKLDDIFPILRGTPAHIARSELQVEVEKAGSQKEPYKSIRQAVLTAIVDMSEKSEISIDDRDLLFVCEITCLDPSALNLAKIYSEGTMANGEPATAQSAQFVRSQVMTIAASVSLSLNILREDFIRGLASQPYYNPEVLAAELGDFSLASLDRTIYNLIEQEVYHSLRQRCGENISKMQIYTSRQRRTPKIAIENLFESGMTKIRRNKLWIVDPDSEDNMLFAPKNLAQLKEMMNMLMIEPELQKQILKLWNQTWFKVEFNVAILLNLLAQTTTNLNYRLEEILSRFGMKLA